MISADAPDHGAREFEELLSAFRAVLRQRLLACSGVERDAGRTTMRIAWAVKKRSPVPGQIMLHRAIAETARAPSVGSLESHYRRVSPAADALRGIRGSFI